jgi:hypothetical protein
MMPTKLILTMGCGSHQLIYHISIRKSKALFQMYISYATIKLLKYMNGYLGGVR